MSFRGQVVKYNILTTENHAFMGIGYTYQMNIFYSTDDLNKSNVKDFGEGSGASLGNFVDVPLQAEKANI